MAFPMRNRTFAVSCATATSPTTHLTEADVISDNVNLYDSQALGTAPTKGDVTEVRSLKSWDAGSQTPGYAVASTASFDAYGRMTGATDVRGNHSTTGFTPATGGPVTATTITNSLGWTSTSTLNPAWGEPVASTD